jgi:MEMO1 family protein
MGVPPLAAAIRPPLVDGLFYPAKREALAAQVDELLSRSTVPQAAARSIITPHAGYEYTGEVMAAAYRAVSLRPVRTAVLIGPVHREAEEGIFLPESGAFATPLGRIPVDAEAAAALLGTGPLFRRNDIPHLEEHCLELQLPFLARLFPHLSIVPLLVGSTGMAAVTALARALRLTFAGSDDYTVFVATANMASYMTGRDPEKESAAAEELILAADVRGIVEAAGRRLISACGVTGMAAVLSLAGEGCAVRVLARARSGGDDEEESRIVRYAAVSIESDRRIPS